MKTKIYKHVQITNKFQGTSIYEYQQILNSFRFHKIGPHHIMSSFDAHYTTRSLDRVL